ncbi:MAG: murein biosynthesis integral membrane protein MurJ [Firmicutes bacterium]|nr:murein biosynthesis integral membrane protein MurJ [Bacillota bacterium]
MTKRQILQAAGLVMAVSVIGRLLGFVREQVIAAKFGTTQVTDAYLVAFTIPNLLYVLIGGALATAFIPVFTAYLKKNEDEAWEMASTLINATVLVMSGLCLIGILTAPYLVRLIAPGFDLNQEQLTSFLTRLMFPTIVFYSLSLLIGGILNAYQHFAAPAFISVAYSTTVIASIFLLAGRYGIIGLALGTVVATAVQVLIQIPALRRRPGKYRLLSLNLAHPGARQVGRLILPVMIGTAANQIYVAVNNFLASGLIAGSIAALNFGNKLVLLPFNLFVMAIKTAIFPTMSTEAAGSDLNSLGRTTELGIKLVAIFTIPASVGLFVLARPIVRLLFEHGAFNARSTEMTAQALMFLAIGLFAMSEFNLIDLVYFALQDTRTPVKCSITAVIFNIILSIILVKPLQLVGLALSNSLASILNMLLVYWLLTPRLPSLKSRGLLMSLAKILAASLVMGAVTYLTALGLETRLDLAYTSHRAVQVGAAIIVGVASYGIALFVFRLDEAFTMLNYFRRKLLVRSQ